MWDIEFAHQSIERYIESVPATVRAELVKQLERLALLDRRVRSPNSRPVARGLFELKNPGRNAHRIYYAFLPGQRLLILQIGSKKTQKRYLALAISRLGGRSEV